jgi:hypothetical protein
MNSQLAFIQVAGTAFYLDHCDYDYDYHYGYDYDYSQPLHTATSTRSKLTSDYITQP